MSAARARMGSNCEQSVQLETGRAAGFPNAWRGTDSRVGTDYPTPGP